jgi:hypothetical protein
MSAFVFLGPSLPVVEAVRYLSATFLPPAQQGDILRLLERKPTAIGIVDGYFGVVPAVWHKEILLALEAGVAVFGAASMGALRAAELHRFGMVGVGTIFEWYRDGHIVGDDEVAIYHAPAELNYLSLTDALVNIRDTSAAAVRHGVVSAAVAEELVTTAAGLPFSERTYNRVAELAQVKGERGEITSWLRYCKESGPTLKSRDAVVLLQRMAAYQKVGFPQHVPTKVERTSFIERLRNEVRLASLPIPTDANGADERELWRQHLAGNPRTTMLLRVLAREACERLGWQIDSVEVSEQAGLFCAERGLSDADDRARWMEERLVSEEMFWRFINDSLLIAKLDRFFSAEIDAGFANHLRINLPVRRR